MSSRLSNASLGILAALGTVASLSLARNVVSSFRKKSKVISAEEDDDASIALSPTQAWFLEAGSKGVDHIVATVALSGKLPSKDALESAIEKLKMSDPNLDYAIACVGDNNYRLEKTSNICGQVQVVQEEDWKKIAQSSLNEIHFSKPTQDGKPTPTWKVKLVSSTKTASTGALILVLSHMVFDGTSRNRLIRALLKNLDTSVATPSTTEVVPIVSAKKMADYRRYLSRSQFVRKCFGDFVFCWRTRAIPAFIMDLSRSPGTLEDVNRETRQIFVQLSSDETNALIERCKQEKTTVHGALSSAALIALCDGTTAAMGLSHLISLWKQLVDYIPTGSLTGCYVSLYRTNTVVDSKQPWKVARDVKSELSREYAVVPLKPSQFRSKLKYDLMLQTIFGNAELSPEYTKLQRIPTLAISNNGMVDLPEVSLSGGRRMNVEGSYATSARHNTPGNLAVLNVQTIPDRKLCITLGYYSHVWSDKMAHEFLERFCLTLKDMTT